MSSDKPPVPSSESAPSGTRIARIFVPATATRRWIAAHPRKFGVIAVTAVVLQVGSIGLWSSLAASPAKREEPVTLERALLALDTGHYVNARLLAQELRTSGRLEADELGGPDFVLGIAAFKDAADEPIHDQFRFYLAAAQYLEEARAHGFPDGRRAEGIFTLGKALYETDRYVACRRPLLEALHAGWSDASEIHRLLSTSFLESAPPDLDQSLDHITQYLSDETLSPVQRVGALLDGCRIQLALGHPDACHTALAQLPPEFHSRPDALLMKGRLLLHEARVLNGNRKELKTGEASPDALTKYQEAVDLFRQVQDRQTLDNRVTRIAMYLTGVATTEMGTRFHAQALEPLSRTRKLYFESSEGLAATLLEADLLRQMERSEEAVAAYRLVLSTAGDPQDYSNSWIPLDELKSRMLSAYQYLSDSKQFDRANELLEGFRPMFAEDRHLELVALTVGQWAAHSNKKRSI